LYEKCGNEFG
jgi:hypothetical protein